ncbi:VOC family protein [Streptomyces sp. NPDC001389]|uniref:VOC family protein n=1 Tax=Streptomyces sp. NPDC001389 TaxID=3364569 RepID=UPI00369C07F5
MMLALTVIYTDQLEACRAFYSGLGLTLVPEQHGRGPAHYAAALAGGGVLELYPAGARPATGYLRLGLAAPAAASAADAGGRRIFTDPDGRTVILTTTPEETTPMTADHSTRETIRRILGDAQADITEFPSGNLSITVHSGDHTATIDGAPESGWGWTVDPGTDDGFTGHENVADDLEAALLAVRGQFSA